MILPPLPISSAHVRPQDTGCALQVSDGRSSERDLRQRPIAATGSPEMVYNYIYTFCFKRSHFNLHLFVTKVQCADCFYLPDLTSLRLVILRTCCRPILTNGKRGNVGNGKWQRGVISQLFHDTLTFPHCSLYRTYR